MSKRATIVVLSIIAVAICLYFSNPGEEKHLGFLQKKLKTHISWSRGTNIFTCEDSSQYNYNDYFIFSTTTATSPVHERTSVGFLWMIF